MKKLSLNTECKNPSNDPIGQLFAGMEKTMVEIFYETLQTSTYSQSMVMFGLYINTEKKNAQVFRADVTLGQKTKVYQGDSWLPISDAFNMLMCQFCSV